MSSLFNTGLPDLTQICDRVQVLSMQVGKFIRTERNTFQREKIEHKGQHDLVSYVDKTAEKMFIEGLSAIVKHAGFIAEENTLSNRGERFNWIIDPLDGTTNFVHGVPCFATSVALADRSDILLGVIYEINMDECFYAWKGGGAWKNGERIRVSDTSSLEDSLLATGFPYVGQDWHEKYIQLFSHLQLNSRGMRRPGSAATDIAYVACGRFDGFYEYGLSPWDVAAGKIIVEEAGGICSEFNEGHDPVFNKTFVCGNSDITPVLRSTIQQYMK
jgi:myo-inositol-1(or 4)-monophosphatase